MVRQIVYLLCDPFPNMSFITFRAVVKINNFSKHKLYVDNKTLILSFDKALVLNGSAHFFVGQVYKDLIG